MEMMPDTVGISPEIAVSDEVARSEEQDLGAKCEMTEEKENYEEEIQSVSYEGEGDVSDEEGNEAEAEGEASCGGGKDEDIPREEDTRISQSTENISGDEAVRILEREVKELRRVLDERDRALERMTRECAEFSELYPDTPVRSLPDEIWAGVKDGVPIAAAYALYEKRRSFEASRAALCNEKNNAASAGGVGAPPSDNYYSPSEVRRMSQSEVRRNYAKILESMSRWS